MYPQFFVFIDGEADLKLTAIIKGLWDLGYMPFVDGENKDNNDWFKNNLKTCEYRLYWFEEDGSFIASTEGEEPDLLVVFSEGLKVTNEEWDLMTNLIRKIHCTSKEQVSDETMEKVLKVFQRPPKVVAENKNENEVVELPKSYAFRSMIVGDTAFYEIVKPNVIEPYVTMVEDYKKYPMDMFTNWFHCFSFGVSGYDAAFLHQLFRNVNGGGELNLEDEFRKRVMRVKSIEDEPRIWRNSLENVIEMYEGVGEGGKRKRISGISMNKKV